jgi:hypothetical protein
MRQRPKENFNLFEAPKPPEATPRAEPAPVVAIKDACPRCKGRSLKTVRSWEHSGASHYCAGGCLSEDRTEAFYFTPQAETFVEQVEREEAKKVVATELPAAPEIETEALPEGEQVALIETGEKWEEEWRGMPEFVQEDLSPWKSIYVHFEKREDMERFAKVVKQKIGLNTRSIWYPEAEIGTIQTKRYVDKGPVDIRTKTDELR